MNGVIILNKPANITSRDVINQLTKILNTKKIGHTGTLDPIATGVLVICISLKLGISSLLRILPVISKVSVFKPSFIVAMYSL